MKFFYFRTGDLSSSLVFSDSAFGFFGIAWNVMKNSTSLSLSFVFRLNSLQKELELVMLVIIPERLERRTFSRDNPSRGSKNWVSLFCELKSAHSKFQRSNSTNVKITRTYLDKSSSSSLDLCNSLARSWMFLCLERILAAFASWIWNDC